MNLNMHISELARWYIDRAGEMSSTVSQTHSSHSETRFPAAWWETARHHSAQVWANNNLFSCGREVKWCHPYLRLSHSAHYVWECGSGFITFPSTHTGTSQDSFDYLSHLVSTSVSFVGTSPSNRSTMSSCIPAVTLKSLILADKVHHDHKVHSACWE